MKEHFSIVEPVEYILDKKEGKSFQYVPMLLLLTPNYSHSCDYRSFYDGSHSKENCFLSGEEFRLSLLLYCDDFEICNPLGTSREKHKVTGIYWVLADIPALLRSTLSSIYLLFVPSLGKVIKGTVPPSHGVKRPCAITEQLDHFHVTTGYPPDVMHDLLEGICTCRISIVFRYIDKEKVLLS